MTRFDITSALIESPVLPRGAFGDASGPSDPSPEGPLAPPDRILLEVYPWEVDHGDILDGFSLPVDSIQGYRGQWWFGARGTWIRIQPAWGQVAVWRPVAAATDVTEGAGSDPVRLSVLAVTPSAATVEALEKFALRGDVIAAHLYGSDDAPPRGYTRPFYLVGGQA